MSWNETYTQMNQPDLNDVKDFVNNELYAEFCASLESKYRVSPKIAYSGCSAQPGWNLKYKKGGKSLCTIYPMEGYFITLVVIGAKEQAETELLIPSCTGYIRDLYEKTPFSCGGRWLMIDVTDRDILDDVIRLIGIRRSAKI